MRTPEEMKRKRKSLSFDENRNEDGDEDGDMDSEVVSITKQGVAQGNDFLKAAMKVSEIINVDFSFVPSVENLANRDSFSITRRDIKVPIFTCSKTKGCKLSQPIDDKALEFIECMYPKAGKLAVATCSLASAIKLINLYEGKNCVLEFSEKIQKKIREMPESDDKTKFSDYCSSNGMEAKPTHRRPSV